MTSLDYAVYDAFSAKVFGGSPAALVADAQNLDTDQMQRIAREFALPATGFVTECDNNSVRVRFFSTQTEYPMCGHGTIALATWLVERGDILLPDRGSLTLMLHTPASSAELQISLSADGRTEVMLTLRPAKFVLFSANIRELASVLGGLPEQIMSGLPIAQTDTDFRHLIVPFDNLEVVDALAPDFSSLKKFCEANAIDTVMVFSLQTCKHDYTVHCREFAPAVGTTEAAATGTTNRALACYLHDYAVVNMPLDGRVKILAEQGYAMGRPSTVQSELSLGNGGVLMVRVGGVATRVMQGTISAG